GRPQFPLGFGHRHTAARYGMPADSHTAYDGEPHASGLALLEASPVRLWTAQWGLLGTSMWVNIQRITGVPHCANVVWLDLAERRHAGDGVQPTPRCAGLRLPAAPDA